MKTIALKSAWPTIKNSLPPTVALAIPFLHLYFFKQIQEQDPTIGLLDAGIWQLLALSSISFLGLSTLAWWVLQKVWVSLGLPQIKSMVSQFKNLTLCQQFAYYWASFALLLLAAVGSLIAVF